jgi:hypothetical protein
LLPVSLLHRRPPATPLDSRSATPPAHRPRTPSLATRIPSATHAGEALTTPYALRSAARAHSGRTPHAMRHRYLHCPTTPNSFARSRLFPRRPTAA